MADRNQHPSRDDETRRAVFDPVDLQTAELEIDSSIYNGFAAAIMVKGQPRTVALTREYGDAVQLMALIERARSAPPAPSEKGASIDPTPDPEPMNWVSRVMEIREEGDGFWAACSGCQESVDGYVSTKDYSYSAAFGCQPGGGCSECGGLGVKWDTTDYDALVTSMLADMAAEEAPAPCKSCNGSGMDAGSRFNRCPDCSEEAPAESGEVTPFTQRAHEIGLLWEAYQDADDGDVMAARQKYLDALSALRAQPQARSGKVTWHSSGEDEGPDIGLQLDIGGGRSLWLGEGQKPTGWQIAIVHDDEIVPVADVIDHEQARDLFDRIASALQPQAREEAQPWTGLTVHMVSAGGDIFRIKKWENHGLREGSHRLYTTPPAPEAEKLRVAVTDIAAERQRQVDVEGWSEAHDDEHDAYQIARAAGCYAFHASRDDDDDNGMFVSAATRHGWPWDRSWWKPKDRRSDLVRAGALIVAEIERLDRQALAALQTGGGLA